MKKIMVLFVLFSICSGCKKNGIDVNKDFVGTWVGRLQATSTNSLWKSVDYQITIKENGHGIYSKEGSFSSDKTGIVRVKDEELRIGSKSFSIQKHPVLVEDTTGSYYEMIINNIEYQKQ